MAGETSIVVIELSKLLNRFWAAANLDRTTLRNPSGVSMKLGNFQGLDPVYLARGRKGLPHGGRLEKEIWAEFSGDRTRLKTVAAAIRSVLEEDPESPARDEMLGDEDAAEGAILTRLHKVRERDAGLARRRKDLALKQHGRLICEACDFDFAAAYGLRGEGYIEVHHTRALATLKPGERTKLSELALLCANCHRMVHARRPWLAVEEVRTLVREQGRSVV